MRFLVPVATLLAISLSGCIDGQEQGVDSSSHWLQPCDTSAECGSAESCVCGNCVLPCDSNATCEGDVPTMCTSSSWMSCAEADAYGTMCVPTCAFNTDCFSVGENLECRDALCVPATATGEADPDDSVGSDPPESSNLLPFSTARMDPELWGFYWAYRNATRVYWSRDSRSQPTPLIDLGVPIDNLAFSTNRSRLVALDSEHSAVTAVNIDGSTTLYPVNPNLMPGTLLSEATDGLMVIVRDAGIWQHTEHPATSQFVSQLWRNGFDRPDREWLPRVSRTIAVRQAFLVTDGDGMMGVYTIDPSGGHPLYAFSWPDMIDVAYDELNETFYVVLSVPGTEIAVWSEGQDVPNVFHMLDDRLAEQIFLDHDGTPLVVYRNPETELRELWSVEDLSQSELLHTWMGDATVAIGAECPE